MFTMITYMYVYLDASEMLAWKPGLLDLKGATFLKRDYKRRNEEHQYKSKTTNKTTKTSILENQDDEDKYMELVK